MAKKKEYDEIDGGHKFTPFDPNKYREQSKRLIQQEQKKKKKESAK